MSVIIPATETVVETEETEADQIDTSDEVEEIDWKDKYEGQKKVNTDLERKFKAAATEAANAKASADLATKPAEEQALEAARAEARTEATAKADVRILRSELKAAATGKLADPADAALYIDLSKFAVNEDGDVDADALNEAITDLIERKPHLAAVKQTRFDGAADQGARDKNATVAQWTEADLERATDDETVQAKAEGKLNSLLGIKK